MQAFRFRLEKVLEWYTRQAELEERRLALCLAAVNDARKGIAAQEAERLSVERDVVSRMAIPARDFVALGLYRLGARERELQLKAELDRCEREVQAQRVKHQAAQRRVRSLEKLRERRVAEHVYAETRELEGLASDAFFAKWAAR
jgi:flagellar biosynthesis chaperone FliJ